jgi:hypothetical protein
MSEPKQKFSASLAKDAVYQQGLRSFMEYRDLGIADATHGKMRAHIVRVKQGGDTHDLHTTGLHKHECTDDLEILEIYAPAVHPTVAVERMPEVTAAAR